MIIQLIVVIYVHPFSFMSKATYLLSLIFEILINSAGGYVMVDEKLPRFVVPDLTDFNVISILPRFSVHCFSG